MSQIITPMWLGTLVTLKLFAVTLVLSLPLGLVITYLYMSKNPLIKNLTGLYILIMRGTPLLLQLYFVYFGLPYVPYIGKYMVFDRFTAASVAFVLNYAAYFSEIYRGGFLAIDHGQYEAAKALGLGRIHTLFFVILPQMFRVILPAISNETIILVKDTALITVLAQPDLLHVTKTIVNKNANVIPFAVAALFYLVISYLLTLVFNWLEKKYKF